MSPRFYGFIHEKLDIKILILYVLEKLPGPVHEDELVELVMFDGGFSWFEYNDCLADLETSGHITYDNNRYEITELGRQSVQTVGSSLPYSVRMRADKLTAPVAAAMRRSAMIETETETEPDGACFARLRMSDGSGEIITVRIAAPSVESADGIGARFRKNAESITTRIIQLLTED